MRPRLFDARPGGEDLRVARDDAATGGPDVRKEEANGRGTVDNAPPCAGEDDVTYGRDRRPGWPGHDAGHGGRAATGPAPGKHTLASRLPARPAVQHKAAATSDREAELRRHARDLTTLERPQIESLDEYRDTLEIPDDAEALSE